MELEDIIVCKIHHHKGAAPVTLLELTDSGTVTAGAGGREEVESVHGSGVPLQGKNIPSMDSIVETGGTAV